VVVNKSLETRVSCPNIPGIAALFGPTACQTHKFCCMGHVKAMKSDFENPIKDECSAILKVLMIVSFDFPM
jgi:hypothetical protein